jgi:hypothetical protein
MMALTNLKGYPEKYMKKLIKKTEIEDGLKRLDKLTQEEAWMAAAQNDKRASVEDQVQQTAIDIDQLKRSSIPNLISADYGSLSIFSGNQLRENIHKWLSPPDPSTNHNIACATRRKKTATWFFQGSIFREWKSTGSLLWIHGKRLPHPLLSLTSSDGILHCSWLGKKCPLVRGFLIGFVGDD